MSTLLNTDEDEPPPQDLKLFSDSFDDPVLTNLCNSFSKEVSQVSIDCLKEITFEICSKSIRPLAGGNKVACGLGSNSNGLQSRPVVTLCTWPSSPTIAESISGRPVLEWLPAMPSCSA